MTTATISRRRARRIAAGSLALAASGVLLLASCGSSSPSGTAAPAGGATSQAQTGQGQRANGGNFTTGLIADVSGKTLQVQGTDAQTTVTYTSKTTFTEQATVSLTAIKAGSCVSVQSATAASGATTVTATSVSVSAAVNGACTGGMGGARGSGAPSGMPSGAPSGAPQNGAPSGAPQNGQTPNGTNANRVRPVSGKVASVSGSSFTVASTAFGDTTSQTYTVKTTSTTTVTQQKATTSAAVKTGKCATAAGKADSTGAVTATTISLRAAVNGVCSTGFGRPAGQATNG